MTPFDRGHRLHGREDGHFTFPRSGSVRVPRALCVLRFTSMSREVIFWPQCRQRMLPSSSSSSSCSCNSARASDTCEHVCFQCAEDQVIMPDPRHSPIVNSRVRTAHMSAFMRSAFIPADHQPKHDTAARQETRRNSGTRMEELSHLELRHDVRACGAGGCVSSRALQRPVARRRGHKTSMLRGLSSA